MTEEEKQEKIKHHATELAKLLAKGLPTVTDFMSYSGGGKIEEIRDMDICDEIKGFKLYQAVLSFYYHNPRIAYPGTEINMLEVRKIDQDFNGY